MIVGNLRREGMIFFKKKNSLPAILEMKNLLRAFWDELN